MRGSNLPIGLRATLAILTLALFVTGTCAAQQETVLHSFGNPETQDGAYPYAGLVFDANSNLYGTTQNGGIHCSSSGCGTVFELSPRQDGGYAETVLHSFSGQDGYAPRAGLAFDANGNLYGTTVEGGIHNEGTVFEITPEL